MTYSRETPLSNSSKDTWGCNLMITTHNIDYIHFQLPFTVGQEDYDFETMAGGVAVTDQISSCT